MENKQGENNVEEQEKEQKEKEVAADTDTNEDQSEEKTRIEELEQQLQEKEEAYLRLYAEFDNFRKRSAKERIEQTKTAGRDIILDLLPVLDDINRAQVTMEDADDVEGVKEGVELILNKLWTMLSNKGLAVMEVIGEEFDAEIHEAVTEIPAQNDDQKGKVVDQVEKGYTLNGKIIRYPKVVVGK